MKRTSMDQQSEAFLTFKDKQGSDKEIFLFISQVFLSNILFILLMMHVLSLLQWDKMTAFIYIPGILLNILLFSKINRKTVMTSMYAIVAFGLLVFLHAYVINGVFIILNQLFDLIGKNTGTLISSYKINLPIKSYPLAVQAVFAYIGILLSIVAYFIVKNNLRIMMWLLLLLLFVLQSMMQVENMVIINLASVFIGIYVSLTSTYNKTPIIGNNKTSVYGTVFIVGLSVFTILSILMLTFKPFYQEDKNSVTTFAQDKVTQVIHDFRYEKNKTNTFTEGNFAHLSKLELTNEKALEVIMEKPTSLYLRGFTGETYTSDKWTELAPEVRYANSDLFYWLYEEGFHPLNQLSIVSELIGEEDLLNKTSVKVNNVQANSKYLYTPYELVTDTKEFEKISDRNNQMITSSKFFGDRIYQFELYEELVTQYPTLANQLYDSLHGKEGEKYKNNESHYNDFVYDRYTEMPSEVEHILEQHVEKEETKDAHIAYEKAIDYVQGFLSRNITYKLNPEELPNDTDFLLHVLEDSKEGFATHYATVATLIFRYLDIPARYVEGYLVTPDNVEGKEPYEKIGVNGTHAHAWTEIYIDQLGWIPVEVTPPYENIMEPTDTSEYPEGTKDQEAEDNLHDQVDKSTGTKKAADEEDKDVISNKEKDKETNWGSYVTYIILAIMIMVLLAITIYISKKRLEIRKLKNSFHHLNATIATTKVFSYSLLLLHYDGLKQRGGSTYSYEEDVHAKYGESYANLFTQAVALNQVATYSKQDITEANRQFMLDFMEETVMHVIKSKGIFKRIKLKYWDFLY